MQTLFVTRHAPPQPGGMARQSFELISHFPGPAQSIVLRHSTKHLVWFLPYSLIATLWHSRHADIIHFSDAVFGFIARLVKFLTRKPVVVTAHGLDITYPHWLHQFINVLSLAHLNQVICVSAATRAEVINRGAPAKICSVIENGVDFSRFDSLPARSEATALVEKQTGISLSDHYILLSIGRLVPRKGMQWFVSQVMPRLPAKFVLLIVGDGAEREPIYTTIQKENLSERVFLCGHISDTELKAYVALASIFIMPNILIAHDPEGFGLVAIEASGAGLPVVASNLQGIPDAIHNGKNGLLVEAGNAEAFVTTITSLSQSPQQIAFFQESGKKYSRMMFSATKSAQRYYELFVSLTK